MAKKQVEKIFSPGNIILGIIIIVLIASLFFDFFGSSPTETLGCPRAIEGLITTNVIYSGDGVVFLEDRVIKAEDNPLVEYTISALLRNIGEEDITIKYVGLTKQDLGDLDLLEIEPIIISAKSMKTMSIVVPSGTYHKIDLYTDDTCEGITMWHEFGEGSKYAWELEADENVTSPVMEEPVLNETVEEVTV
ncbi:MAG: hypothetical protein KKF89_05420 [Nanoarchaeota archaeon]|nr:hypothetical protein [Nanoarchaeota archaeon]MBU1855135.1 hypothetical protein [Nanoarchaeota archaeon]